MDIKKKIVLVAATSLVSAGALFAVITNANAADTSTATITAVSPAAEANEPADANEANEGTWKHDGNEANEPADANEGPEVSDK